MRCQTKQKGNALGRVLQIFVLIALVAILAASLAACADKSTTEQQQQGGAPPAAPGTVSDIFRKNIDLSAIQSTIQNLAKDKILASIDGANGLKKITSRTLVVEMADGTSQLFDINAQLSEEDKAFLEEIEEEIYAIVGLDSDATVSPADEAATAEKLKSAAEVYVNLAKSLIQNTPLSSTKLAEIDETLELRVDVPEFRGFEEVVFSSMTESMAFTSEGNLESENCTMSYAFGINLDSSITAFVVTYADNGETAQEKIDDLANPGAAIISEAGTFPAGVVFELPPLEQPEKTIGFEEAYNQVFEGFVYSDTASQLAELTTNILPKPKAELLFADFNDEGLTLYADVNSTPKGLATMEYRGKFFDNIKNYLKLLQSIDRVGFPTAVENIYNAEITNGNEAILAKLNDFKTQLKAGEQTLFAIPASDFTIRSPISNTTTEIDFSAFAEKFIPKGTQPVLCYVDSFGVRNMESKDEPYFNVGYFNQCDVMIGYMQNGELVIRDMLVVVPQYNNSTYETMYAGILGEEGTGYKIADSSTTAVENPILTGATSGIEPAKETEMSK